jgi:hypothetical protein
MLQVQLNLTLQFSKNDSFPFYIYIFFFSFRHVTKRDRRTSSAEGIKTKGEIWNLYRVK